VLATNENDVLDEFFRTGVYRVRAAPTRTRPPARRWTSPRPATSSASCSTCWAATAPSTRYLFADELAASGRSTCAGDFAQAAERFGFVSGKSTHADRLATIRDT
jgi:threonine synthase